MIRMCRVSFSIYYVAHSLDILCRLFCCCLNITASMPHVANEGETFQHSVSLFFPTSEEHRFAVCALGCSIFAVLSPTREPAHGMHDNQHQSTSVSPSRSTLDACLTRNGIISHTPARCGHRRFLCLQAERRHGRGVYSIESDRTRPRSWTSKMNLNA